MSLRFIVKKCFPSSILSSLRALEATIRGFRKTANEIFWPLKKGILTFYIKCFPKSFFAYEKLLPRLYYYRAKDLVGYSKEFIHYFECYKQLNSDALFKFHESAAICYLYSHNINNLEKVMKEFSLLQEEKIKQNNLADLGVEFIKGNVFVSYNVHAYLDTHIKAMMLGWRANRKFIQFLAPNLKVSNPTMLKYWNQYITFINDEKVIKDLAPLSRHLEQDTALVAKINGECKYIEHAKCIVQKEWEKQGREPLFTLDDDDLAFGQEQFKKIGIPEDAWFVSLHVRDAGFKTGSYLNQEATDSYRNSDIDTYELAVEEIIARGGYVIRVGDPNMKPMKKMDKVFDYAHSDIRSNRMDIFLFSQCRFFLGVSSGPVLTPILFGVPVVMTNFAPMIGRPHANNCLFIPKMLWLKDEERYASFEEVLSTDIGQIYSASGFSEKNIDLINNSPEELRDVVVEMMDGLDNNLAYTNEDEVRQDAVTKLYQQYSGYGDMGRIGNAFIKKYAEQGLL